MSAGSLQKDLRRIVGENINSTELFPLALDQNGGSQ
jgi:hypothetical protein